MADSTDGSDSSSEKTTYQLLLEKAATPECLMGFVAGMVMPRKFAAGLAVGVIAGIYIQQTFIVPDVEEATKVVMSKVQEKVPKKS